MNRVLLYIGRFAAILAGYITASLAASAFIHLLVLGAAGFEPDSAPAFVVGSLFFSVPFTALFVGYFGFIPAMAAILIGEIFGLRSWLFHALAGAAVGAAVIATFWQTGWMLDSQAQAGIDPEFSASRLVGLIVGSGIVGGLAYWLVAGRWAGNWHRLGRDASSTSSGPSES